MRERAYTFGVDNGLVGVLTEPDGDAATRPAVLFWNAGLLHHVGPHRLFVDLARAAADLGFAAFRSDIGGLGDSRPHRDTRPDTERALADIVSAMDSVEQKIGAHRFILIGLCSGAQQIPPVAVDDARVVGGVLLDGFAWPTLRFRIRHFRRYYGSRLLRASSWRHFLDRRLLRPFSPRSADETENMLTTWQPLPPVEQGRAMLRALIERGVELLYVYTGGYKPYNYESQFKDVFGELASSRHVQLRYAEQTNHTYTLLSDREELKKTILDWMRRSFL